MVDKMYAKRKRIILDKGVFCVSMNTTFVTL